jgi:hypothetical protein
VTTPARPTSPAPALGTTVTGSLPTPPSAPGPGQESATGQGRAGHVSWRTVGIGLTSLATPAGIWIASPVFGEIVAGTELAVMLTIIGTALFGSQELSERAFRLLRWIGNRPEPPGPAAPIPLQEVRDTSHEPSSRAIFIDKGSPEPLPETDKKGTGAGVD